MRAGVVGNTLYAWNATGDVLWRHRFAETLWTNHTGAPYAKWRTQIIHEIPPGDQRLAFAAAFADAEGDSPSREEIYCFSSTGSVLWRYSPEFSVRFGGERFHGPWNILHVLLVARQPRPTLLAAISHSNYRPGFVVEIDVDGKARLLFAQAGNIHCLHQMVSPSAAFILAGGVNNEYNAASLAIIKDGAPPSRSPQTPGTRFEIQGGPIGDPEYYYLLPPSEVNIVGGEPYNKAIRIADEQESIFVETRELELDQQTGKAMYYFNRSLDPIRVSYGDGYAAHHRRLQAEGKLKHSLADCPQLHHPVPVRRWRPKSGWNIIQVPFDPSNGPDAYRS